MKGAAKGGQHNHQRGAISLYEAQGHMHHSQGQFIGSQGRLTEAEDKEHIYLVDDESIEADLRDTQLRVSTKTYIRHLRFSHDFGRDSSFEINLDCLHSFLIVRPLDFTALYALAN